VAALDEPNAAITASIWNFAQHVGHPRTCRIDDGTSPHLALPGRISNGPQPVITVAPRRDEAGSRHHHGSAISGIARVERNKSAVFHPAVRIDESAWIAGPQAFAEAMAIKRDGVGRGQFLSTA